jgi:hypothetical protein
MKHCPFFALLIFLSLLFSPYVMAEQAAPTSYNDTTKDISPQLQEKLEKAVVPISKSLAYLLTTTLPEADGKPRPISISIEPVDAVGPDEPIQAIVFHCAFGPVVCEPFFRACASLHLKCTGN